MYRRRSLYRWTPALRCALLIGCSVSTTSTPIAASPTTAPTIAPIAGVPTETPWVMTPTETPSPVPAADPAAARLLPAPLYFIDAKAGISRIEVDGKTITPVTNEDGAVLRFALAPADGSLAYLVQDHDGRTLRLVHSDGHGQG